MTEADMSGKTKHGTAEKQKAKKEELERDLEEGLQETFPASDAVAAIEPAPDDEEAKKK
jgi:hypothetical protein